ncbi:hypothetical protein GCM10010912_50840 [Paenibacillus albidus]|uniref:Uncharacterized protein n=2 Tax=Paenibacillus albidus TaxID=2041023 RepID=A0A917CWA1_9BACL|nr:hypothetical protein GCM10010912_50840 [Paenibacillus albidus]
MLPGSLNSSNIGLDAFSLAVLYLIPNLDEHALKIKSSLKPGGVYYATFADYTSNPSLPAIRERINGNTVIPMQNHTLDTISQTFMQAGFQVSIRRMLPIGFVDLSHGKKWYNQVADQLLFAYNNPIYSVLWLQRLEETEPKNGLSEQNVLSGQIHCNLPARYENQADVRLIRQTLYVTSVEDKNIVPFKVAK